MEKNYIEDNDSSESFELFEPILEPILEPNVEKIAKPVVDPIVSPIVNPIVDRIVDPIVDPIRAETMATMPSIPNSMSIVTIPDEYQNSTVVDLNGEHINEMSNALQLSQNMCFNDNTFETTRVESFANSFQNGLEIEEQELMTHKLSLLQNEMNEEVNNSVNTLSNSKSLTRFESNDSDSDSFAVDLENNLKQLKEENEKFKSTLEKNNQVMKQQLKTLQEWQLRNNETIDEHKRKSEESKAIIEQLRDENSKLKDEVLNLEGMAGLKLVEELSTEVASLRSKCDQMSGYKKFDVNSELMTQDLSAQLVGAKRTIDSMALEINSLKSYLNDANSKLESLPVLSSQLEIYERDFKIEEMAKLAALKEVDALEKEVESLKKINSEMEEKLDKGQPVLDLKTEPTGPKSYTCPKCWRSFERFQAIQNHFERCLDQDGLFT